MPFDLKQKQGTLQILKTIFVHGVHKQFYPFFN